MIDHNVSSAKPFDSSLIFNASLSSSLRANCFSSADALAVTLAPFPLLLLFFLRLLLLLISTEHMTCPHGVISFLQLPICILQTRSGIISTGASEIPGHLALSRPLSSLNGSLDILTTSTTSNHWRQKKRERLQQRQSLNCDQMAYTSRSIASKLRDNSLYQFRRI